MQPMATPTEILIATVVSGGAGIAGALAGFCTNRWLRRHQGQVTVSVSDWQMLYKGRGESGSPHDVAPGEAEFIQIFFTCDVFNGLDEPTGYRQVRIEFDVAGEIRLAVTPGDADSLRVETMREEMRNVEVINLAPRHFGHWHFRRNLWGDEVASANAAEQVYLSMTDSSGQRHRYLIADLPRKSLSFAGR